VLHLHPQGQAATRKVADDERMDLKEKWPVHANAEDGHDEDTRPPATPVS
jgi:hypothetical protein